MNPMMTELERSEMYRKDNQRRAMVAKIRQHMLEQEKRVLEHHQRKD